MDKLFWLRAPVIFSLELTPSCNNHCPGCGNVFEHQKATLSAVRWIEILNILQPHARQLKLTGGEPTLYPEFLKIIENIDRRDIPYTIFTNARWKQPDLVIQRMLRAKHLGGLLVSLHGADAETHEFFTGTARSFDEACRNIRQATDAGLRVHTSTVLHAGTIDQIEEIVALSQSLGARRAVFNRFLGPFDSPYQPVHEKLQQAVITIENLRRTYPLKTQDAFTVRYGNCIPQCFTPSSSSGCWAGVAYCTVDPWGNVRPCNHSPTIAGNLFQTSLEEIWQNEIMQQWRSLTPESCFTCSAYERCHGSCRALAEIDSQARDPLIADPLMAMGDQAEILELYEYARPVLNCEILPANPGLALVKGLSIFPVFNDAQPILDELNGQKTLAELQATYGSDALDFTGELIRRGFVSIVNG